ncbi:hypothetical protein Tco_0985381, partial [Tanacetum coccineum]
KVDESLNVTFDETHPPSETSPLVDNNLDEEEAIKVTEKKNLENDIGDETLEIDEIINIKESRNHPLENLVENMKIKMKISEDLLIMIKIQKILEDILKCFKYIVCSYLLLKTLARRRASDKQGQDSSKRQKKEKEIADYEEEKDELRMWLIVIPDKEAIVDPEVLHTKFPIVDWESQSLGNMHVYKIIRAYGNSSYHKTFESMLKSFDRHDLEVLHRLVMERFQDNTPEGYNLMLWGDLKILVDPEQDDDI